MKKSIYVVVIVLIICGTSQCHLLIVDQKMALMMEFNSQHPFCHLTNDRDYIQNTLLNTDQKRVKVLSDEEINKIEIVCKKRQLKTSYQGGFIYPGTKWCGPGAVAENYTDLGIHRREDICCREHDHCPSYISRGECKQGICNKSLYTRSHCDCDAEFRRCLQNVNSETANTIGAVFFNIVQVICFKQRSPCTQLQRNGYTEEEADRVCAQWMYRPSDRYVPLMSLTSR